MIDFIAWVLVCFFVTSIISYRIIILHLSTLNQKFERWQAARLEIEPEDLEKLICAEADRRLQNKTLNEKFH